jgi:hypothetical protein
MRAAVGLVILGSACALSGCGASQRDEVQAKVQQFARATANRDYRTICEQVLAPALLEHLAGAGLPCQQAMQIFVSSVQDPTLSIGSISVKGHRASAIALTGARGQTTTLEAIGLVQTGHGWRVSSLGSPRGAKTGGG